MNAKSAIIAAAALLFAALPAQAIVGGAAPSTAGITRSVLTIVGSRGNFCSASLIAPKLVLTAAHCVQPGAIYKLVEYDADQKPHLSDVNQVTIHPGSSLLNRCLAFSITCPVVSHSIRAR
jgi:trypsin